MPSTYLSLHYHLVFSTKGRTSLIEPSWRNRLHEYLGGTIEGLKRFPQGVGGMADHVHLLVGLKATHCLADFMRELKKASSAWVHDEIGTRFGWQEGYAAFTVSPSARPEVQSYIAGRKCIIGIRPFGRNSSSFWKEPESTMTLGISTEVPSHRYGLLCDPSRVVISFLMYTGGGAWALHHRLIAGKPLACKAWDWGSRLAAGPPVEVALGVRKGWPRSVKCSRE